MTTLDAMLGHLPPGAVRAIKVDVEGAELEVLRGATHVMATQRPRLVVLEINRFGLQRMGASETEVRAHMVALGYTLHAAVPGCPPQFLAPDDVVDTRYVFNLICTRD